MHKILIEFLVLCLVTIFLYSVIDPSVNAQMAGEIEQYVNDWDSSTEVAKIKLNIKISNYEKATIIEVTAKGLTEENKYLLDTISSKIINQSIPKPKYWSIIEK